MDCCGCLSTDECPPGYRLLQPEDLAVGKDGKSGARMSRVFVTDKAAGGAEAAVGIEATGPTAIGAEVSSPPAVLKQPLALKRQAPQPLAPKRQAPTKQPLEQLAPQALPQPQLLKQLLQ